MQERRESAWLAVDIADLGSTEEMELLKTESAEKESGTHSRCSVYSSE